MKETNLKLEKYLQKHLTKQLKYNSLQGRTSANYKEKLNNILEEAAFSPISNYLDNELDKNNFQNTLFNFIDKIGKKDSDIYNKAFIDRRLFSKIRSNPNYHPSKNTVISLGIALELNINDFEKLLNSASYSLPKNNYFDLIIRFCIEEKIYDIIKINNYLDSYNCQTLN